MSKLKTNQKLEIIYLIMAEMISIQDAKTLLKELSITDNHNLHIKSHKQLLTSMCSCGGTINVHQKTCEEYREEEQQGEDFPIGMLDLYGHEYESPVKEVKCECGAEKVGSSGHSSWCNKYKEF